MTKLYRIYKLYQDSQGHDVLEYHSLHDSLEEAETMLNHLLETDYTKYTILPIYTH